MENCHYFQVENTWEMIEQCLKDPFLHHSTLLAHMSVRRQREKGRVCYICAFL